MSKYYLIKVNNNWEQDKCNGELIPPKYQDTLVELTEEELKVLANISTFTAPKGSGKTSWTALYKIREILDNGK